MSARTEIVNWIEEGCNLEKGVLLFSKYGNNDHFLRLCMLQPEANQSMLTYQLRQIGKISDKEFLKLKTKPKQKKQEKVHNDAPDQNPVKPRTKIAIPEVKKKFRDDFPYLRDADCPHELLILVGYKITAYHAYIDGHKSLFECKSLEDCTNNARTVIENYQENRLIYDELEYYKEHKHCLGKHPIFKQKEQFDRFLKMDVREMVRLHDHTIPHRIWRIKDEIAKRDKPHLDKDRKRRLMEAEAQLAELGRILNVKTKNQGS